MKLTKSNTNLVYATLCYIAHFVAMALPVVVLPNFTWYTAFAVPSVITAYLIAVAGYFVGHAMVIEYLGSKFTTVKGSMVFRAFVGIFSLFGGVWGLLPIAIASTAFWWIPSAVFAAIYVAVFAISWFIVLDEGGHVK